MDVIKCNCGNYVQIGVNYCSECGEKINYVETAAKYDLKERQLQGKIYLYILGIIFGIILFLFCVGSCGSNKIPKDTPEYEQFYDSFVTVMSFYPEIDAYKIADDSIIIHLNEDKYSRQEKIKNVIQTMAHNLGLIDDSKNIRVRFYYNGKFLRSFY